MAQTYDPEVLHRALAAAGLPVVSVDRNGAAVYSRALSSTEAETAKGVFLSYDPTANDSKLKAACTAAGITTQAMVLALWEKVVNADSSAADEIRAKISHESIDP